MDMQRGHLPRSKSEIAKNAQWVQKIKRFWKEFEKNALAGPPDVVAEKFAEIAKLGYDSYSLCLPYDEKKPFEVGMEFLEILVDNILPLVNL